MKLRRALIGLLLALGCGLVATAAGAQSRRPQDPPETLLRVRIGWETFFRPGRWSPVYVTLAEPKPRNVVLEFRAPHGSYYGVLVRQVLTIGPQPQTSPLYLPLRYFGPDDLVVTVRDAASGKRLATCRPNEPNFTGGMAVQPGHSFFGISGRRTTLGALVGGGLPGTRIQAGHLDAAELPMSPIGYDCLDALVLNGPNLNALVDEQQQAIVEWLRAGGQLLLWPGDDPVPESSPLVDVLPVRVGTTTTIDLPADELKKAGLSQRFGKLPARELRPAADATAVPLLGGRVMAYQRRVGLGRVIICPVDLASLQFDEPRNAWALWKPVLKQLIARLPDNPLVQADQSFNYGGMGDGDFRQANAARQVADLLGNVPGAGRFGFGYVAGVLMAMMVIVGPVDWFVLKRLGRQPWTWATTTGWIALVTLAAVYAGHIFKSGDLHYRTFELVDQADARSVARTALTALYSPRTTEYEFATDDDSWWQPATPGDEYYYGRQTSQEIGFDQSPRGNRPGKMVVNVWNLRFLAGEAPAPGPAMVAATLHAETEADKDGKPRRVVVGTLRNLSDNPLTHLAVRTKSGWGFLHSPGDATQWEQIEPGKSKEIRLPVDWTPPPPKTEDPNTAMMRYRYPGVYGPGEQLDMARLWDRGGEVSMRRTDSIDRWLGERDDLACVYAQVADPPPAAGLKAEGAVQAYWKVVRALVPLAKDGE